MLVNFILLLVIAACIAGIWVIERYKDKTVEDGSVVWGLLTSLQVVLGLAALAALISLPNGAP